MHEQQEGPETIEATQATETSMDTDPIQEEEIREAQDSQGDVVEPEKKKRPPVTLTEE